MQDAMAATYALPDVSVKQNATPESMSISADRWSDFRESTRRN
jgi:hypothetical protein